MTREEFISEYCERSGTSWKEISQHEVVLPCFCGDELCKGWAMVSNSPSAIKSHMDLYAPDLVQNSN